MIIKQLPVGPIQTNCYVVGCDTTKAGVVIDPGGEPERILPEIERLGLSIKYILNTHAHFDHVMANHAMVEAFGVPLGIHPLEIPMLQQAKNRGAHFGVDGPDSPMPDFELKEGQKISFGTHTFEVLFTPGHSIGHVSFYEREANVLFDGDVLFNQGIGRTDLPGGNYYTLMNSITEVLMVLPDETAVYCGHGPSTTIGQERRMNPWLK